MITHDFGAFRTDAEGIGSKSDLKARNLAEKLAKSEIGGLTLKQLQGPV